MGFQNEAGSTLNQAGVNALFTEVTDDPLMVASAPVYESFYAAGEKRSDGPSGRRLLVAEGEEVRQSRLDRLFPAPTISTVTPATGSTSGGTAVTIKGTDFSDGAQVTFGGTAATNEVVSADGTTLTCTTPAHASGAVTVVVTGEQTATASKSNGFTYA